MDRRIVVHFYTIAAVKTSEIRSWRLPLKVAAAAITAVLSVSAAGQTTAKKFSFGDAKAKPGVTRVSASSAYEKARGYGFEPSSIVTCSTKGASCSSREPFYFSVAVPEGNYRVTLTLGDRETASSTVVKAELRRLMLETVDTPVGKFVTRSFVVNVRARQIAADGEVKLKDREKTTEWWAWDEKLTLEFNGSHPSVRSLSIERVEVPTIYLLGDSTVCDQPREPYASWGQMLTRFFDDKVAVANYAESGESLKSSYAANRLAKVLSLMKRGDYLLIQYGHNDEKEKGDGVGAFTTFKASLKQFVRETRDKGGIPVVITPMNRRTFDASGRVTNSHGDYPEAIRQVAREENVALIDLNAISKDLYEALGPDGSSVLFKEGDATHHSRYGSYELARSIVQSIRDQDLPLSRYLVKGISIFDPKKPDPFANFAVPPSPLLTDAKPLGN